MRRRTSGTGPENGPCGPAARFPGGCCPSVVSKKTKKGAANHRRASPAKAAVSVGEFAPAALWAAPMADAACRTVAIPTPRPARTVRYSAPSTGAAGSQGTLASPVQATN